MVLCDTNGGSFPDEVYEVTKKVLKPFDGWEFIATMTAVWHCQYDDGSESRCCACSRNLYRIRERCGNANLSTLIPNLQIKKNIRCIPEEQLSQLTATARYIAEVTNISLDAASPYVGNNAFAHKGGMHVDGVNKASRSFEHIPPHLVGNSRKILMSEVSGKNTLLSKIQKIEPKLTKESPQTQEILDKLKLLEHKGYQFEGAESSFELLIRKHLGKYQPFFELNYYKLSRMTDR